MATRRNYKTKEGQPIMPLTIYPYLYNDTCWVFDEERLGLKEEALVMGMSEMITRVVQVKQIENPGAGFALRFSNNPFEHDIELCWTSADEVARQRNCELHHLPEYGNWYRGDIFGQPMMGWLCPALFLFFSEAPKNIYAQALPLPAGVDVKWQVAADDPRARRFVSASGEMHGPEGT